MPQRQYLPLTSQLRLLSSACSLFRCEADRLDWAQPIRGVVYLLGLVPVLLRNLALIKVDLSVEDLVRGSVRLRRPEKGHPSRDGGVYEDGRVIKEGGGLAHGNRAEIVRLRLPYAGRAISPGGWRRVGRIVCERHSDLPRVWMVSKAGERVRLCVWKRICDWLPVADHQVLACARLDMSLAQVLVMGCTLYIDSVPRRSRA